MHYKNVVNNLQATVGVVRPWFKQKLHTAYFMCVLIYDNSTLQNLT